LTVLVTGATGLIGRALVKSLVCDHGRIHALGRDRTRITELFGEDCVRAFAWDPATEEIPEAALEHVDTIFHLMGEPIGGRWTKAKIAAIVASRVTSARKLATALKGRPCRLVCASSFGIYPGERGTIYQEAAVLPPPLNRAQEILHATEQAAFSASTEQTRVNIVRFGLVCAENGYPSKLVRLFRNGMAFIVGDGEQIVPVIDLEDAVTMLRWVASGEAGDGPINCVAPVLPRNRDVANLIAAHLKRRVWFALPVWLAKPLLGGSADYFLLSYEVWPGKAIERGFNFQHPDPLKVLRRALASSRA
jgi:uncharacterized protein